MESIVCGHCGFDLTNMLANPACPKCGQVNTVRLPRSVYRRKRYGRIAGTIYCALSMLEAVLLFAMPQVIDPDESWITSTQLIYAFEDYAVPSIIPLIGMLLLAASRHFRSSLAGWLGLLLSSYVWILLNLPMG